MLGIAHACHGGCALYRNRSLSAIIVVPLRSDDGNNPTYTFFIIFIFDRLSHIIVINCLINFDGATLDDVIDGSSLDDDRCIFRVILQGVK